MNQNCYSYEEILLDPYRDVEILTDVAIVLLMENPSDYVKTNLEQIKKRVPTKRLILQYNKGFLRCNKSHLIEQKSNYDICDASVVALKYAFNHLKLINVLLLEDDAYFLKNIHFDIRIIREFIKTNDFNVYNLGPLFYVINPFSIIFQSKHIPTWTNTACHACIYHRNFLKSFEYFKCVEFDTYIQNVSLTYMYYNPICLQLFRSNSSNINTWSWFVRLLLKISQILGMNREYPPKHNDYILTHFFINLIHLMFLIVLLLAFLYGLIQMYSCLSY